MSWKIIVNGVVSKDIEGACGLLESTVLVSHGKTEENHSHGM
jgi:hypothetical protein